MASHGRYTILGKLADGGMAEIFLATQHGAEGFEKQVVLKRILTQYSADPQFRNMFLDEAHIGMGLQHSNIVQILDLGVAGGRYFLALELVDGWDLEKILQRARAAGMIWPAALGLYVTASICRALAYAHAKVRDGKPLGIVHRDISPNNVLVSDHGEVKLTDFGIAKAQRKREQTAAGVIKGKVAYMSPEQAIGAAIDRRSDIFSVGSMLYRMATDRLPFEASNDMESLLRVQKGQFVPPEQARETVGSAVSGIIMRAMRFAPSERYQSADEMLADVERALRNEFHSAGQTELKSWLEQLARADGTPTIGKQRLDTSGLVQDVMGTDLSAGTSFELDDFEKGSDKSVSHAETEISDRVARTPPPGPPAAPPPLPPAAAPPLPRQTTKAGRRRSGFWWGVAFALAAVIGARYLLAWIEQRGVKVGSLSIGGDGATTGPTAAPSTGPTIGPAPGTAPPSAAVAPAARPSAPPIPTNAAGEPAIKLDATAGGAGVAAVDSATAPAPSKSPPPAAKPEVSEEEAEPDEEALMRTAVPNPESAVIGEEEEDGAKPATRGSSARAAKTPSSAAAHSNKALTSAVLHITTAPAGAVVRTKSKVLGRTPINLHFKTDNSYEITFIKSGYEPATRHVAVHGTADRKLAVTLKKKKPAPARSRSFFHPHR